MTIARNPKHSLFYQLNNIILERVNEFNDLGLIVTNNLSWSNHIKNKVSKAERLLGLIKRTFGYKIPAETKKLLYNSLVRSTLSYGSVIWSTDKGDLQLLERVQRRATKYILNNYELDYKSRLLETGMIPFSYFKEINDLCFL